VKKIHNPLILVTNDDGYEAKGIAELVEVVKPFGEVVVVAPDRGNSAKSHSVTMVDPIYVNLVREVDGVKYYACSGTPVDSVKLAISQILPRKPDFLVSGINHGCNSSINIIYSGTMAAALEGAINGIPSIGFSITSWNTDADFTVARKYSEIIFEQVLENGLPEGICLNVNIPYIPMEEIRGVRICRQARGTWKEEFEKRIDPRKRPYYWLTGDFQNFEPDDHNTDDWALKNNYVTVVPSQIDFTAHQFVGELKKWKFE